MSAVAKIALLKRTGMPIIGDKVQVPPLRGRPSLANMILINMINQIKLTKEGLNKDDGKYFALRDDHLLLRQAIIDRIPKLNKNQFAGYFVKMTKDKPSAIKLKRNQSKYKPREKLFDQNKINANNKFKRLVNETNKDGKIITLDDRTAFTSRMMSDIGYLKENILVPNNDSKVVQSINSKKKSKAFCMYLGDLLDILNKEKQKDCIDAAWFDYCQTLKKYVEDIHKYFSYKLPKDNSIFGVTWSYRVKNYNEKEHIKLIRSIADQFDYHLELVENMRYKCVRTVFFRVRKIIVIDIEM